MKYFLPLAKEEPRQASSVSHKLMLKAGLIRQTASGIFAWLPLGTRVIQKLIKIMSQEQNKIGAQEFIIPTIQTAQLWEISGRYKEYGNEMLRITDQYNRQLVFTPTNEEQMTSLLQNNVQSYRELPQLWYTIQWKFRDEIRPRAGVMRSREFLMLDTYSFDLSEELARVAYEKVFLSFMRIFHRLGIHVIPAKSSSGLIGGDMNHEFVAPCPTGETTLFCPSHLVSKGSENSKISENSKGLHGHGMFQYWQDNAAYTEDAYVGNGGQDPRGSERDGGESKSQGSHEPIRGIELGHTFYFGTKYTKAFSVEIADSTGRPVVPHMGSYGIGITRLVAAMIEMSHDRHGIVWPRAVAPFSVSIININGKDPKCVSYCQEIYEKITEMGVDALLDNGSDRPGVKLARHDLIGTPTHLIIGPQERESQTVLLKNRATQQKQIFQLKPCLTHLKVLK